MHIHEAFMIVAASMAGSALAIAPVVLIQGRRLRKQWDNLEAKIVDAKVELASLKGLFPTPVKTIDARRDRDYVVVNEVRKIECR